MRPRLVMLFSILSLCFSSFNLAQVPDSAVSASAPVSGAGHHYIGNGAETVSPADGLLSFDLPIQTPPGRQLSIPFGIRYSSSEEYYLSNAYTGASLYWQLRTPNAIEVNGWGYKQPMLTGSARVLNTWSVPNYPLSPINHQCDSSQNYVFRGLDGAQYTLQMGAQWVDQAFIGQDPPSLCSTAIVLTSSVHHIMATSSSPWTAWPQLPPVTVVDRSGTTYQFTNMPSIGPINPTDLNPPVWAIAPSSITDRNGNQIVAVPGGFKDTLGRTVFSATGIGNDGDQVTVSGLPGAITMHWTNVPVTFPEQVHSIPGLSNCTLNSNNPPTSIKVVSEIDFPNNTKYTFGYDSVYGRVSRVGFPAGGYVRYAWGLNTSSTAAYFQGVNTNSGQQWSCYNYYDTPVVTDRYVSYDGSTEVLHQHFAYSTTWNTASPIVWDSKITTVTSTDMLTGQVTITTYNYVPKPVDQGGPYDWSSQYIPNSVPVEKSVVYKNGSNGILKTVNKTWLSSHDLTGEQTILDNGQGTTSLRCYDTQGGVLDDQVTNVYEYGFQSEGSKPADPSCASSSGLNVSAIGPLRRQSTTVYNPNLGNIVNEPSSVTIYDGSGSTVKQTTFEYTSCPAPVTSGAINLVAPTTPNGDLCSSSRWVNNTSSWAKTSYAYYDTGQVYKSTDPCGNTTCGDMTGSDHTTTYSYADSFSSGTPPGQTNAYLTQVTHPNNGTAHVEKFTWGYADGLLRTSINQNNQTTTYMYNTPPAGCSFSDNLNRISQVDAPDGAKTTFCYNDAPYNPSTPSPSITTTQKITSSLSKTSVTVKDGFGHTKQTQLTSDPQGTVYSDTTYDGFGRVWKQSNPHRSASSNTDGTTTTYYDVLGRSCLVVPPGGTLPSSYGCATQPSNTLLTTYSGNKTTVTDQTGRQRRSFTDSLGRLIEVDEPGNGQHDAGYYTPGTGSISIAGSEQSYTFYVVCGRNGETCPQTVYDSGYITATINGESQTASWGQGDTAATVSAKLAAAINTGSYATATSSSGGVTLTAKGNGGPSNYSLSVTFADNNYYPQYFTNPSFTATASGPTLTGSTPGSAAPGSGSLSMSTPAATLYTYNAVGDLLAVFQSARQRTFTYDSLSRMLTSANPETGTITYTYDANSNVNTKTDARGITLTYKYDVLNRTLSETYSNGDPTITYAHDGLTPINGCTASASSYGLAIGRRTAMCDAAGQEAWTYNDITGTGWQTIDKRTTSGITKTTTTQANLDGSLNKLTYPTSRIVNYVPDAAGRPSTATDSANGMTYAKGTCGAGAGVCYAPPGEIASATIDVTPSFTGINLTNTYNNRLQPNELKASSTGGNAFDLTYNFVDPATQGNNGNVWAIANNLNNNRSQIFTYDPLNRIVTAGTLVKSGANCWGYLYSYDIWANLLSQAGDASNYPTCNEPVLPGVSANTSNHITTFAYDAAGNTTADTVITNYTWDAQSQLKSATYLGATTNYTYDGDGQRVSKVSSKLYWYGSGGEILAETDASGNTLNEYVFFGGKRVAMLPAGSTAQFYVEDFLGTSRVVTTNTGVVCYDADFYPYGGERTVTNSCTQNNYKFEGKERDTETLNDEFGARYYSWRFGRWLSADWSTVPVAVPYANLANPQTLNLYAMVADDPESFADLDGHEGNACGDYLTCLSSGPSHGGSEYLSDVMAAAVASSRAGIPPLQVHDEENPYELSTGAGRAQETTATAGTTTATTTVVEKTTQAEVDKVTKPLIESAAEKIGLRFLGKALGLFIGELLTAEPLNTNEQIMLDKTKGLPPDAVKLKKDQGYRDKGGNIWKKDKLHKDHWDVSDRKGRKIKEVRFDGTQLWPDGPKNK